jgi:PAS domain S-box-containing protein
MRQLDCGSMICPMTAESQGANQKGEPIDLRTVFDTIPALVVCALPDGSVEFVNRAWQEYTGSSLEKLTGWGWQSAIHTDDLSKFIEEWRAARVAGKPFETEARVRRADGNFHRFLIKKVPLSDQNGQIVRWYGTGVDIEEQKKAEDALRVSESYLTHAQQLTNAGSWAYRPPDICEYWSEEMFRIFGLDPSKGYPPNDQVVSLVHPEDRQRVEEAVAQHFKHGRVFDMKYRIVRADGQVRVIRDFGTPVFENGAVTRFVGALMDITEQEQTTEELRRSEFLLAEGQRLARVGSWVVKAPDIPEYWSPVSFEIFGIDPEKGPPKNITEFLSHVHPDDRKRMLESTEEFGAVGHVYDLSYRIVRSDGEIRVIREVGTPVHENNVLTRFIGAWMDITEQERRTEELQRSGFYLTEGQRLAHMGSWSFNPSGFFDYWSPELYQIYGLEPKKGAPSLEQFLATLHPQDRESMAETIEKMHLEGSGCDVTKRIVRPDGEIRHIRCVGIPVLDNGVLKGFLGTAMDVTGQERLTQELRRREAYLAEAQKLSHTGSFGWSALSGEISWSDETFRIFEYDREVKPTLELVLQRTHPEDRDRLQETLDRAPSGETNFDIEYRLLMPDGAVKYLHVIARALRDPSGNLEFVGAVTDVTSAKQEEGRIRLIINTVPGLLWTARPDGWIDFISRRWLDYTGLKMEQGLGWGWEVAYHPDDLEQLGKEWRGALATEKPFEAETRLKRFDGEYRWFLSRAFPLFDRTGRVLGWYGSDTDIHDRKVAEEKIRQNEKELRTTIETIPASVWSALPNGSLDFVSKRWVNSTGLSKEEWLDWGWKSAVHPEDLDGVIAKWEAALLTGESFEAEYRFKHEAGEYRWYLDRGVPLRNEKGNIIRWYGTLHDIDDRKRGEEALRQSEEQWRDVFENNPTMYFMVDAAGTVLAVNPFGAEQLGYGIGELVGQSVLKVFYDPDREAAQKFVAQCLRQLGQSMSWELRKIRKNGSILWVRETARAVIRANEPVVLVACEDITVRKQAEEKIREQEIELRQVLNLAPQHVAVLAADKSSLYVNQAALDYHGITFEQWRTSDPLTFIHPEDRERLASKFETAFISGSPYEYEGRLLRSDGEYRWFFFRFNPLRDEQGHTTRWYVAATDFEDRKQAEERLQNENVALREEIDKASMFEEIIGTSSVLKKVLSRVSKVAPTDSTVLVTGETGTGKELVARAIHRHSQRSSGAFVSVNCAAIPRDLIASELFGHEKGAFTGALQRRLGRFELAEGGTIFLDEVGELPTETQIALLHVLQEHEFERVGGTRSFQTNVRVIAATNRDLQAAIAAGTFRSDLFYRLNVFPIDIPPLRERREDIPVLVEYFIDRYARKSGKNIRRLNKKTLDLLQSYPWPGNIRELQNVIERSVIVCETETFSVDESWLSRQPAAEPKNQLELSERLAAEEKSMIETALRECGGRVFGPSGAAVKLRMPRSTLESKIRSLKIDKNRFRVADPSKNN